VITEFLAPIETVSSKISVADGGPTAAAFFSSTFGSYLLSLRSRDHEIN
jgi:hypothetical protein